MANRWKHLQTPDGPRSLQMELALLHPPKSHAELHAPVQCIPTWLVHVSGVGDHSLHGEKQPPYKHMYAHQVPYHTIYVTELM